MKISIRGPIIPSNQQWIYDWLDMEATSPKKVLDLIEKANGENIELEINSGGGSVFDASEIYTSLKDYEGKVEGKIIGVAASAASVIAMACETLKMSPTAQMMCHNATSWEEGDYRAMDGMSKLLKNTNQTIASAYKIKTGKTYEELLAMMDNTTWFTAEQAKEYDLIDEIMFEEELNGQLVASVNNNLLPQKVINKIINEFRPDKPLNNKSKKEPKEDKPMNLEKFKNEHPDLFKEILNQGISQGVEQERERIQEIENIALPGYEELINKAKFDDPKNASQVSIEIIKEQKNQGQTFLNNAQDDAGELEDIDGAKGPQDDLNVDPKQIEDKEANSLADVINKKRGVK
ncbi:MAG: Clp protease ClpP [Firmicutes bacterium]|nr:Clp protease ClpP [Bacillota bacterium]